MLASRLASCAATKASVARPSRAFAILVSTSSGVQGWHDAAIFPEAEACFSGPVESKMELFGVLLQPSTMESCFQLSSVISCINPSFSLVKCTASTCPSF